MKHTVESEAANLPIGERISVAELQERADRKNAARWTPINYRSLEDSPLQLAVDFLAIADRTMSEGPADADQAIRFAQAAATIAQAEEAKRLTDKLDTLTGEYGILMQTPDWDE